MLFMQERKMKMLIWKPPRSMSPSPPWMSWALNSLPSRNSTMRLSGEPRWIWSSSRLVLLRHYCYMCVCGICVHVRVCVCVCVHTYACMGVYICVCVSNVCVLWLFVCICVCINPSIDVQVHQTFPQNNILCMLECLSVLKE